MDEQKETLELKLDQIEHERDKPAEKNDGDFRKLVYMFPLLERTQSEAVYDFFEQITL